MHLYLMASPRPGDKRMHSPVPRQWSSTWWLTWVVNKDNESQSVPTLAYSSGLLID